MNGGIDQSPRITEYSHMNNDGSHFTAFDSQQIHCEALYDMLRTALLEYSRLFASVDIEIFAIEMEIDPDCAQSADPALWDEFQKRCREGNSTAELIAAAADFVEHEIVLLRHVEVAKQIVSDLRSASLIQAMRLNLC
jgi:hypothetical protein